MPLSPEDTQRLDTYAQWLLDNQALQGSPDWVTVANAYRGLRQQEVAGTQPAPTEGLTNDQSGTLGTFAGGAVEGNPFVAVPDLVTQGVGWLGKKTGLYPEDYEIPQIGPWLSEQFGLSPDRDNWAYLAGNIFGGGVGGGARQIAARTLQDGVRAGLGQTARVLGQETLATAGGLAGAGAGGALGGDVGAIVGGLAGGITPEAARAGFNAGTRTAFGRSDGASGAVYDALIRNEVPPSAGLVGGRGVPYLENAMGLAPVLGGQVIRRQERQVAQVGDILRQTAGGMRTNNVGAPPQPPDIMAGHRGEPAQMRPVPPNPEAWNQPRLGAAGVATDDLGQQVRDIAGNHLAQTRDTISRQNTALEQTIGANTPIPVQPTINHLQGMRGQQSTGIQDIIDRDVGSLERARGEHQLPVDQALHSQLSQTRNQVMSQLQAERGRISPDPRNIANLERQLRTLETQIRENYGLPYGQMRRQRTEMGEPLHGSTRGMAAGEKAQAYRPMTEALEQAADQAGIGDDFRRWLSEESQLYARRGSLAEGGDLAQSQSLIDMKTNADVFNWVMGTKHKAVEKFDFLQRAAGGPDTPRWRQFVGDFYERLGRANPGEQLTSGANNANALETFSPKTFHRNWEDLDQGLKDMLRQVDPDLVQRIDDTVLLSSALKERGKASNPSGTTAAALPYGMVAGGFGLGGLGPTGALMSAGSLQGMISTLLSDAFSRAVANRTVPFSTRMQQQIEQLAGRAGGLAVNELRDEEAQ